MMPYINYFDIHSSEQVYLASHHSSHAIKFVHFISQYMWQGGAKHLKTSRTQNKQ